MKGSVVTVLAWLASFSSTVVAIEVSRHYIWVSHSQTPSSSIARFCLQNRQSCSSILLPPRPLLLSFPPPSLFFSLLFLAFPCKQICGALVVPSVKMNTRQVLLLAILAAHTADTKHQERQTQLAYSPPFYPSPWMDPTADGWADAYAKAKDLVSQMTLLEKVNLTTGVG